MIDAPYKAEKLIYFDPNHEGEVIKEMAMGMSMDEVCEYFGAPDPVALSKLSPPDDFNYLKLHFKQGRANGNKEAVKALFNQMNQRGGGQVALSYLARFADDWCKEVEADNEQAKTKTFKVVLG